MILPLDEAREILGGDQPKKIRMEIVLTVDDPDSMYGGELDQEGKDWFFNCILTGRAGELVLHSNEIGDSIGQISVVSVEELP